MLFIVLKSKISNDIRCGLYRSFEDLWQANGSRDSFNYYWEILETFKANEEYSQNIEHLLSFTKDPFTPSNLAKAFCFGLQCGRNEKKILKARIDELTIVAGRARWQGTESTLREIENLQKRLAELE
ncbi:MAG: hypothetical protein A2915_03545 [Candidatus Yanofskybacteria bacterium RIFCSPLOWO2_01_FULL_41_34]|uniref:Uncharacterized protein n=1 Tax=Candidatus Yanofskybacteria bacterium RIFCSPHIGHO2_01_FULL_41_26 TaxID=1802661 RepID=A0A1F8EG25_9BACT|nr:MAG: hypothetical protein A2649_01440 [Candidatus Yanofskybacteria bacterium RIFCSPHIGHO2_01_FULL_41_26]OGN21103.1 MAG: hypothetical protein A2915_03545 [Candidatus Yanofskybacteria bacterium RIFCSPLOWO2_01_FULL_41_34]